MLARMNESGSDTSSTTSTPVPVHHHDHLHGHMEGSSVESSSRESSSTTGTFFAISGAIILKVYLDASASRVTEVPITPQTTVGDVLQCCKEPGEEQCHLAELWRGCERPVLDEEKPYEILQQWGIHRDEVRFFLRHELAMPTVNDGERMRRAGKNGMMAPGHQDNGTLPHGVDLTLSELQDMAARQQQQIEAQQQLLVAKEQRLRFLKQQELRHEQIAAENERLRKLREKVEAQELKLKKLRALRGQVSEHKGNNNNLTAELEMIKSLFNEKEKELAMAVNKVEELTTQLEEIRSGPVNRFNSGDNRNNSPAYLELEKLRKELMMRNKLNENQNSKLAAHREVMHERKEELSKMDIRIAELQQRLRKNRSIQHQQQNQQATTAFNNQRGGSLNAKIGNRPASANIAAVEPYIKHSSNNKDSSEQQAYTISKHDPKYQTLPPNIKLLGPDGKRLDGEPNGNSGGGIYQEYGRTDNGHLEKNNNNTGLDLKVDINQTGPDITGPSSPGKSGKDLLPKETIHRVPDYKPSKGHATAFNAMEETLKKSERVDGRPAPPTRPVQGPSSAGYKPSNLSNFTARPFGSTYSTAMFANRPNLITTQQSQSSSPITTNSISSPGAFFPKTSTPIQQGGGGNNSNSSNFSNNHNDMKEIFITGAPSTSSSSMGRQSLYTTAQSGSLPNSSYPPLSIATSQTTAANQPPPDVSPRSRFQDAKQPPHYQIASSRPQEPKHPQLASDAPSPTSSNQMQHRASPHLTPSSPSRQLSSPSVLSTNNKTAVGPFGVPSTTMNNIGRPPAPGHIALTNSTKVNLSEHHVSNSSKDSSPNSSTNSQQSIPPYSGGNSSSSSSGLSQHPYSVSQSGHQQPPKLQQNQMPSSPTEKDPKKDITSTSVSSALSVLMSGPTTSTTTTRPFRYAPKSVIANTYMRKLGSNTLEEYRRTMNQIYKDFQPPAMGVSDGSNSTSSTGGPNAASQDQGMKQSDTYSPDYHPGDSDPSGATVGDSHVTRKRHENPPQLEGTDQSGSMYQNGPPPYRGAPAYDMDAERLRYKPNAPKTLRRRLSSGESDDLARFNKTQQNTADGQNSVSQQEQQGSSNNGSSPGPNGQNVVRVDTLQDSYNNNFSSENQAPQPPPLAISYDIPHGDAEAAGQVSSSSTKAQESKPAVIRRKKTNLKAKGSVRHSRRVSFDPLALLLDASLEGELELVKRTAAEVTDPSAANDEGITALHNAICAGHYDIVKFLAEFGCNVNAPDSDGWTPLHCAASCNNLAMVRLLVEHGACIFATTISDHETAAEKCEEDEDGYDGCSEYLYSIQEKLGIINKGVVYAVFDYKAQNPDELTFRDGDSLMVLRKGDDQEKDWWWTRLGDREGYIPRNLLGLYPRVPLKSLRENLGNAIKEN